jgi:hypothetical protein
MYIVINFEEQLMIKKILIDIPNTFCHASF